MRNKGFTLVEMLVVITILVVLAGLLFVAYGAARERSRRGVCAGNLHQIGAAGAMYAEDHDGLFPPYTNKYGLLREPKPNPIADRKALFDAMAPYLRKDSRVWFCPSDPLAGQHTPNQRYLPGRQLNSPMCDHLYTSYIFMPMPNADSISLAYLWRLVPPAYRVWAFDDTLAEGPGFHCKDGRRVFTFFGVEIHIRGGNHRVGANCVFADARVKFYRYGETIAPLERWASPCDVPLPPRKRDPASHRAPGALGPALRGAGH
jgi:prepilin-type N-terminal cleavage/methylation domain-containing protein